MASRVPSVSQLLRPSAGWSPLTKVAQSKTLIALVGISDHRKQPLLVAVARAVGWALGKVIG